MTVPNIDTMNKAELSLFVRRTSGIYSRNYASTIFDGKPEGYADAVKALCKYARNLAVARASRLHGDIQTALLHEGSCDRIYNSLPDYARW